MKHLCSLRRHAAFFVVLSLVTVFAAVLPVMAQRRAAAPIVQERTITAQIVSQRPMARIAGEAAMTPDVVDPNAVYSNITGFTGNGVLNGGAATDPADPSNTITRLLADDLRLLNATGRPPYPIDSYKFSILNSGPNSVSPRIRTRFWLADGPGGGPGTLITLISFTLNSPLAPNTITTITTGPLGALAFSIPSRNVWAGFAFDNNQGNAALTVADLNALGAGIFTPVDIGSSQDLAFLTTNPGAFGSNNPPGATFNTAGVPDTYGWELSQTTVPTAGGVTVSGRVTTADGRGITAAKISLTDPEGNVQTAVTDRRGEFSFADVTAGKTYVITAASRRYTFEQPSQVITVTDQITGIDFTGAANGSR